MFLLNLNGFNSSPSLLVQDFAQRKGSSKVWKEKGSKWFYHFFSLFMVFFCCITYVFFFLFWVSLVLLLCFALLNMFLLFRKYKNSMCFVYIGTCVPWMAIETKFSKLCIFCDLDEHLYVQLSKWILWLLFVMSKIKLSLVLNTRITLFDEKDKKILRERHK